MDSNEQNVDRNWNFNVNLAGLQAPTGKGNVFVPEGYYKAAVKDMYINPSKNPGRVIIKLNLADAGPYTGVIRTDGLNIPKSEDDNVRYYWRGLAESAGYTPAQLDNGQITIGPDAFKGKTVHIYYTPKEEGNADRQYENITYLAPAEWNQQRQAFEAGAAERAAQQQASQAPAGSALGGGSNPLGNVVQGGGNALGGGSQGGGDALGSNQGGSNQGGGTQGGDTTTANDVLTKLGYGGGQANA